MQIAAQAPGPSFHWRQAKGSEHDLVARPGLRVSLLLAALRRHLCGLQVTKLAAHWQPLEAWLPMSRAGAKSSGPTEFVRPQRVPARWALADHTGSPRAGVSTTDSEPLAESKPDRFDHDHSDRVTVTVMVQDSTAYRQGQGPTVPA